jgi:hypothetical protein
MTSSAIASNFDFRRPLVLLERGGLGLFAASVA